MRFVRTKAGRIAAAFLSVTLIGSTAWAASLQISPINIFINAPDKAGAVSIGNRNEAPVALQIRVVRWTQRDGQQVFEPARDIIANPPAMTIPGNQTYTIRLARLVPLPPATEESYRLLIDELPAPSDPATPGNGVRMLLRTSLPVFIAAKGIAPKIAWRLRAVDGRLELQATNSGNRHIKLVDLAAEGPAGRVKFNASGIESYVLPGSTIAYKSEPLGASYAPGTQMTITTAKGTPFEVREPVTLSGG